MEGVLLVAACATLIAVGSLALIKARWHACAGLSRRDFLILAALGAASLAAACRRLGLASLFAEDGGPTKLSVLGHLGDVWRSMSRHASGAVKDKEAYDALEKRMEKALAQLEVLVDEGEVGKEMAAALSAAFRERYAHIEWVRYVMATCYKPSSLGWQMQRSRNTIEEQVKTLNELAQEGKLTPQAEAKAREALAKQVAFQTRLRQLWYGPDGTGEYENPPRQELDKLDKEYRDGRIQQTPATDAAARALVDFSLNRLPGRPPGPREPP